MHVFRRTLPLTDTSRLKKCQKIVRSPVFILDDTEAYEKHEYALKYSKRISVRSK